MAFYKSSFAGNLLALVFGSILSLISLEVFARLLPASDLISLETPIECEDLKKVDLKCLPRRKPGSQGVYTLGSLPPLPIKAFKRANDFGQLSDVNFKDFKDNSIKSLKVISIGDSFVEALQVDNDETFHGLLNTYTLELEGGQDFPITSTAFGAAGLAFPSYLKTIEFVKNNVSDFKDSYLIIPIISNDFDESFKEYQPTGIGFYFTDDNSSYNYYPYPKNLKAGLRRTLLNQFAFARYLLINLNAAEIMHKYPICKLWVDCSPKKEFVANVVEETEVQNPRRFSYGYLATEYFLENLSQLRKTKIEKKKTIFVLDSDRHHIYDKKNKKSIYFEKQRNNFIKKANLMGFSVIDTKKIFEEDFANNKKKFEFVNDNHWNERGHKVVSEEILKMLKEQTFK